MKLKLAWQIEIPRRSRQCSLGGESFIPEMEYYSILLSNEKGEIKREDFCSSCWSSVRQKVTKIETHGHWKASVPASQVEEEDLVEKSRDEKSLDLLKKMHVSDAVDDLTDAFVLALYLARKKILYLRQQWRQKQDDVLLYEIAATEEILAIKKIPISQLQVHATQQRLVGKLL